ncbi:multiple organellar RNA editing factor 8, chloroplastic/mitochondrial-like isoform X2 [Rhododendron vialii]|uniref:multiple organellar RNA editing factor 8, chloroplastic/mitochondrial-like isoform X2 n=1 Tax=Rhododendron vialii TaxID=182163 RepID=UPI00265D7393|nr:multiple organellar RNA editing factor 8, chloroplastic/mitochondrial-like isoform X2 [Rhododendron vialii]
MASRLLSRSLLNGGRMALFPSAFGRFYSTHPITKPEFSSPSTFSLLGTLIGAASANIRQFSPTAVTAVRGCATVPYYEKLEGCDFEHWEVIFRRFHRQVTRDEIIDTYVKTLAMVMGSEDEARMKFYSISTQDSYSVGVLASEELAKEIEKLPRVLCVWPDFYLIPEEKHYAGMKLGTFYQWTGCTI